MDQSPDWARIWELFHAARERPQEERGAFLDSAASEDADLRAHVEALLQADAEDPRFLASAQSPSAPSAPAVPSAPDAAGEPPDSAATRAMFTLPRVPRTIGHYHIKRVIGAGGMGTVYEAVQEHPRRVVALKILKAGIASRSALRRFEYESQILARLHHPGIAHVYEAGTHDDGSGAVPFFAMEYIRNAKPITEYADAKKLGTRERLELFTKVCEAVHHGHQKAVIHRDLKPGNILVDADGQPKVIDFGVARSTDSDLAVTTLQTDIGQLIGTMQYMSPEQCEADPHGLDIRSDVYALGVVLYELLCGNLPYDLSRKAVHEAARVIREQVPPRPSSLNRSLRGDLETIALTSLEKDRDRRYRGAADLADDIHRFLDDQPIRARPPRLGYQLLLVVRRNRLLVASIVVVTLCVLAALATVTSAWLVATAAHQRAERQGVVAEERLTELRRLTRSLIQGLSSRLHETEGGVAARQVLAAAALEHLQSLRSREDHDPLVLAELANAHVELGHILGGLRSANIGDSDAALSHYQAAVAIREELVREDPLVRLDLAMARMFVADVLYRVKAFGAALTEYQQAADVVESLQVDYPSDDKISRRMAIVLQKLGDVHAKLGNHERASEEFRRSLAIKLARAERFPDDVNARRDLTTAYTRQGQLRCDGGDHIGALAYYRQALDSRVSELEKSPSSARARRDVITAHYFVGYEQIDVGDYEAASETFGRAIASAWQSYEADRRDARARELVVLLLKAQSELVLAKAARTNEQGCGEEAADLLEEAMSFLTRAQGLNPEDVDLRGQIEELGARIRAVRPDG